MASASLEKNCLCIGAANVDIRCAMASPGLGGMSNPATISQMAGGAALNTARMLASQNCMVEFIGLVGDDAGGRMIANALDNAGVSNGLITLKDQTTSHYVSILEPDGSLNIAGNDMRIHEALSPEILAPHLTPAKMASVDMVFVDANIQPSTLTWLGDLESAIAATTVSAAKASRLRPILDKIDVLFTNEAEAAALMGIPGPRPDAAELAIMLASSPIQRGTISDGSNPLWYWEGGKVASIEIEPVIDMVDVTGAGDALAAGIMAALLCGAKFSDSVGQGIDVARKVLRVEGPYAG